MRFCSECGQTLFRYFADGFYRWPETCGEKCAKGRKLRLQRERRELKKIERPLCASNNDLD